MLQHLPAWLTGRDEPSEDAERDGFQFVPALLDASVREAHDSGATEGQRELADLESTAHELETEQRDD
ncbi:MAG: hypothetical protein ABEJ05_10485 [Haloglomus sp.]